MTGFVLKAK